MSLIKAKALIKQKLNNRITFLMIKQKVRTIQTPKLLTMKIKTSDFKMYLKIIQMKRITLNQIQLLKCHSLKKNNKKMKYLLVVRDPLILMTVKINNKINKYLVKKKLL